MTAHAAREQVATATSPQLASRPIQRGAASPMVFTTREIGGFTVRLAQSRAPGRPTVVLTNALPQSIRCWESHWEGLAERFNLIAVDLPGFGLSSGSGDVMRPSAQAET